MNTTIALIVPALLLAVSFPPSAKAAHHRVAAHRGAAIAAQPAAGKAIDSQRIATQVLLDRAGFSPGAIDGRGGGNTDNALHAFQQANELPVGRLDQATLARLEQASNAPIMTQYTIQPQDVAGPFAPQIPKDFEQMATLQQLSYHSPRQLLAEKFHMSEGLLAALNPDKDFAQSGTVITVADVAGPDPAALVEGKTANPSGGVSGSTAPSQAAQAATRVVVDKRLHAVIAYGADNRVLAFYPATIGSTEKPAPSGRLHVEKVVRNPNYTYNPAYAFKGQRARQPVMVPPGPNNPVGVVWIALSAQGYGIHGTSDPDDIGKTQSHGCVRLTNWDALALARLVKKGTPVDFTG